MFAPLLRSKGFFWLAARHGVAWQARVLGASCPRCAVESQGGCGALLSPVPCSPRAVEHGWPLGRVRAGGAVAGGRGAAGAVARGRSRVGSGVGGPADDGGAHRARGRGGERRRCAGGARARVWKEAGPRPLRVLGDAFHQPPLLCFPPRAACSTTQRCRSDRRVGRPSTTPGASWSSQVQEKTIRLLLVVAQVSCHHPRDGSFHHGGRQDEVADGGFRPPPLR